MKSFSWMGQTFPILVLFMPSCAPQEEARPTRSFSPEKHMDHPMAGREAPEIDGLDLQGKRLKLSDFRGRIVALAFWDST